MPNKKDIQEPMIHLDPGLPCAFDCSQTAKVALTKVLRRRKLGLHYVRPWEILPVCDLHLRLIKRDIEVTLRMKEIEEEEKKD
ncbi:hypothetical protein EPA93_19105 [Ktedonosporobacter rubrisoli]|uniref:Uncharacterized protein n=1 Tax=Ktedonosporobacter rubrisoli TaxID=2509675 RepID=A0A4P6JRB4_KTERU|nr:hypothetical protein [Ktedonosporobacter rubrisoli]QBD77988.1 hypothetical protein EPA93_19105 [Ktedonosporobacter rubrisoli]